MASEYSSAADEAASGNSPAADPDAPTPSLPYRGLELFVLALPVAVAATFTLAWLDTVPLPAVVIVGIALGGSTALVGPVLVFMDAREMADAGGEWSPNPALYALGCLVLPYLVVLQYLYVRHEHVPATPAGPAWWYGVPLLLGVTVVSLVGFALPVPVPWIVGVAAGFLLPVVVYQDAKHLHASGASWRPNPATQFILAWFAGVFVVLQPLYAGYYLFRRHRGGSAA